MAQGALQDGSRIPTLATSYISPRETPEVAVQDGLKWRVGDGDWSTGGHGEQAQEQRGVLYLSGLGSTGKGILIGMLSAFGSAALVALIIGIVYFFRYTNRGRILLDRIGRPGEFDDEQQFLREEEEAVAEMDESQRAEYSRAKGGHTLICVVVKIHTDGHCSFRTREPTRVSADRHFIVTISRDSRKRSFGMGV